MVLGDFNEWTRGHVSQALAAEFESTDVRVYLAGSERIPASFPVMHLDHVYYDPQSRWSMSRCIERKTSLVASDHVPLVVDFKLE